MKEQIIKSLKDLEERLKNGEELKKNDLIFLFGLSIIKDQEKK